MYFGGFLFLSVVLIAFRVRIVSSDATRQKRTLDEAWTTEPSQFYRRAYHSSILLGETLYIDGGDVFHMPNTSSIIQVNPYNSTYSLDLSASWSPLDALFNVIDKGSSPVLNRPNLWPASDAKSFYSFNGDVSEALQWPWSKDRDPPLDPQLWQFTPEGINNGTWQLVESEPSLIQSQLSRSTYGNESVYILGGITTWRSTQRYVNDTGFVGSADGIISYNADSRTWKNQSMDGLAPWGWWFEGELHWIDNLGGIGLVVALGGVTALPTTTLAGNLLVPFDDIALFNPLTGEWRKQTTSGNIPPSRRRACSVGVPGDNGTYEIFVHGGDASATNYEVRTSPSQASIDLDQVWVLSIPSFTWYKSNYTPSQARFVHTCHVPGNPPRSQMIAVGGTIPGLDNYAQSADTWPQGLGIFDLTKMQWVDSYAADATPYRTPQLVRDGIAQNGTYPQTWDDPVVVEWLLGKSLVDITPTQDSTNGTSETETKRLSAGAIAGIVVGSTAALALLGISLWYLLRARRRQQKTFSAQNDLSSYEKPELDNAVSGNQLYLSQNMSTKHELPENIVRYEMMGSAAEHELSTGTATESKYEMDSTTAVESKSRDGTNHELL